jgi:hypothetical protein
MLSRPTTDQVIDAVARELRETVLPAVTAEPVRVTLGMIDQLLGAAARRAAHEIAWMIGEINDITELAASVDDPAVRRALDELSAAGGGGLHLADVCARYHLASRVLSALVGVAFAGTDETTAARVRALIDARSARELEVIGPLTLVGRG